MENNLLQHYRQLIDKYIADGRLRNIPSHRLNGFVDFSSNDYLGIGADSDTLVHEFIGDIDRLTVFTSSASRLLALKQDSYKKLEDYLQHLYGKNVLLFNSGYHANTGCVSALASSGSTLIVADKLVHASIIDGMILSKAPFIRFKHNDIEHLRRILQSKSDYYEQILLIVESVYSMDGDEAPLQDLVNLKREFPNIFLYIDEAHGVGVRGNKGLGIIEELGIADEIDLIVGTFGKAIASMGAFVATSDTVKQYLVNSARSFIFSTAIPPINVEWTLFIMKKIISMTEERRHLTLLSDKFRKELIQLTGNDINSTTQIVPWIVGSSERAIAISDKLQKEGFLALPIRKPTVAQGTERIRFSLNAKLTTSDIDAVIGVIKNVI